MMFASFLNSQPYDSSRTYAEYLQATKDSGYRIVTLNKYFKEGLEPYEIIMIHDVDNDLQTALDMARLEASYEFKAT